MAVSRESLLSICVVVVVSSLGCVSSSSLPMCPPQSPSFVDILQSRCSLSSPNFPLELRSLQQCQGFEPVHHVPVDESASLESSGNFAMHSWMGSSLNERIMNEPYLLFSIVFLCLRMLVSIFPKDISFQSFLGFVHTTSELGNIWRDQPNVGSCPSDDQCEEHLGKIEIFQD